MRIVGHETFYLRPSWLTKGIFHLKDGNAKPFNNPEVAHDLGVGRNMARSIGWWLQVTGLSTINNKSKSTKLSALGEVILDNDPYMTRLGTWWLVHASSMTQDTILKWLFSFSRTYRFERSALMSELFRELTQQKGKEPAQKSIQKAVSVALNSYAVEIPRVIADPETNLKSPLCRLNLIQYFSSSNYYQRYNPMTATPEALGIYLNGGCNNPDDLSSSFRTPDRLQLLQAAFALGHDSLSIHDLAFQGQKILGNEFIEVGSLNGVKTVQFKVMDSAEWAREYYNRILSDFRAVA